MRWFMTNISNSENMTADSIYSNKGNRADVTTVQTKLKGILKTIS